MRATKDKSVAKKPALLKKKLKGTKRRMLLIFKRAETHSKRRQKKLIFMSEQSSTDYNEHGMKPKLPGQARQCTFTKSRKRFACNALRILNCWLHMNKESCA